LIAGDDEHPARVTIKPVDDARTQRHIPFGERAVALLQITRDRALSLAVGVGQEPGWLTHDEEISVLVEKL
jgi:hypothetical protein